MLTKGDAMASVDLALTASRCLEAWTSGDLETTRSLLSDDVTFEGPLGHTEGADAYVSGVARMADSVTGVELKKLIVEGDDVCIMYDLQSKLAGAVPTVGWYHFRGDKIESVRAYFDPRQLTGRPDKKTFDIPLFAAALQLCQETD
jgi:ketosteroid isomerase-like protein